MTKQEIEYTIIRNAVSSLVAICTGSEIKVIDLLTGYLWDEEDASTIKQSLNKVVEDSQALNLCNPKDCDEFKANECGSWCDWFPPAT